MSDESVGRAEGRNRSEISDLDRRLGELREELDTRLEARSFLFTLEAFAWAAFQRVQAEIYRRRIGMSGEESDPFAVLRNANLLDVAEARLLRQFCESRHLSSRDQAKLDFDSIQEFAIERVPEVSRMLAVLVTR